MTDIELVIPVYNERATLEASVRRLHAFLAHGPETSPSVGDIVGCGISHPCTAFDKWQLIPVVRDDRVVDLIRTFF